jgi:formylglycine-generating enzyme required for sulfatase activity
LPDQRSNTPLPIAPRIRPAPAREDHEYYDGYYVNKRPARRRSTRTFIAFILVQMFIAGGAFVLTRDYMSNGIIRQAVAKAFKQVASAPAENKESANSENVTVATNEPISKSVVIYQVTPAVEAPPKTVSADVSNTTETETLPVAISPVEPAPVALNPAPVPVAVSPVEPAPVEISPVESTPAAVIPAPAPVVAKPVAVIPAPAPVIVSPVASAPVAISPAKPANVKPATEEIISEPPAIAVPAPKKLASAEPVQQKLISSETSPQIEAQALVRPPTPDPIPEPEAPAVLAQPESKTPSTIPQQPAEQVLRDCEKCPELVMVGAGRFMVGKGEEGTAPKTPAHEVVIKAAFAIGRYEITFDDWAQCVADGGCTTKPSDNGWGLGRRPVINVSFSDINSQYLPWLSRVTGKTYRLPTEDEWEFAARGGASADTSVAYSFGNDAQKICEYGNSFDLSAKTTETNWTGTACKDGFATTAPVGSLKPNALGLFDMHGNVWEWVSDCWHSQFSAQSVNTGEDCKFHVLRGGSWLSEEVMLRSDSRGWEKPDKIKNSIGFRVARVQP